MTYTTHDELAGLLHDWARAIVSDDATAIGRYMTEDWVLVTPEAGAVERAGFLGAVEQGLLTHEAMDFDGSMRVRVYGDAAVVTGHLTNNGMYDGAPFRADEWSTSVFVQTDGGWKCVLTALTPVAGAAA